MGSSPGPGALSKASRGRQQSCSCSLVGAAPPVLRAQSGSNLSLASPMALQTWASQSGPKGDESSPPGRQGSGVTTDSACDMVSGTQQAPERYERDSPGASEFARDTDWARVRPSQEARVRAPAQRVTRAVLLEAQGLNPLISEAEATPPLRLMGAGICNRGGVSVANSNYAEVPMPQGRRPYPHPSHPPPKKQPPPTGGGQRLALLCP